ncbi:MAG: EscU/YscU/HrcU family type III secretion system export apparatus switch protein [Defluviitaleaceae bacterium]|nr:EscU/YscU/HrcU family type III secretion system export apparatus switch protein [Defluviitaleaceae bacterium]
MAEQEQEKLNLNRHAVALKYDPNIDRAPRVIAKGAGYIHDKIVEKAHENKIAVMSDPELVRELTKLDLGEGIPPELYEVVAQVLIFISELDRVE